MDILAVVPTLFPMCLLGIVGYIYKKDVSRLDNIETQTRNHITEQSVRQILEDKIGPVRDDVSEIKSTLTTLSNALLDAKFAKPTKKKAPTKVK